MKITVLGSGTCTSQLPGIENRYPPAFVVEVAGLKILFECSESVRFRLESAGFDFEDFQHVAISHSHPDHCAMFHYIQAVFVKGLWAGEEHKNKKLNFYCPQHIVNNFDMLWNFYFPEVKNERYPWPKIELHGMSGPAMQEIQIADGIVLKAANVTHGFGKVDVLAYRLETPEGVFAFSGDTGMCDAISTIAQDADFYISECSARIGDFDSSKGYGHLNPFEAAEIAKNAGVKRMVLTHYIGFDSVEAIEKECRRSGYDGELTVGQDFQVFEV